jgi:hypothetical protein
VRPASFILSGLQAITVRIRIPAQRGWKWSLFKLKICFPQLNSSRFSVAIDNNFTVKHLYLNNGLSASVKNLMSRYTKDQCGTLACMNLYDRSSLEPVSVYWKKSQMQNSTEIQYV